MFAKPSASPAIRVLLALAAIPLLAVAASGAPIRYDFGGVIDVVVGATGAVPGARFSGSFLHDPDAAAIQTEPSPYSESTYTTYKFGSARTDGAADGSGLELRVEGGASFALSPGLMFVAYDKNWDGHGEPAVVYVSDEARHPADRGHVELRFEAAELPGGSPPRLLLDWFSQAQLFVEPPPDLIIPGSYPPMIAGPYYLGTIDTLSATPVPEPGWTAAALLGVAAWAARRRRRAG